MSQSTVPCGLINQGMTCYLNAVLQTLYMTGKYRVHVLSQKKVTAPSEKNVLKALANLFKKLDSRNETTFQTEEITKALNITNVYEQQDAAEYLQMILHKTPEPSEIFKGVMKTTTTCSSCGHKYPSNTEFLSIPLGTDKDDMYEALKEYQNQLHEMNEDDQLYCVKCDSLKNMETETFIAQWPDILTLQLKRFEMTLSWNRVYYKKNEYKVNIPLNLEIYEKKYELYAIINHYGTYEGGHYTAFIKDERDNWFYFNDHRVKKFDGSEVIDNSCTSAYLLLYRTEKPKKEDGSANTDTSEGKRSDDTCQKPVEMLERTKMWHSSGVNNQKSIMVKNPEEQCTSNKATEDIHQSTNPVSSSNKNSTVSASQLEMFKQKMKKELQCLNEENLHGKRPQLNDIFIESNMTEKPFHSTVDEKGITYSNIFEGENIKTVLTKGDPGIGKTVAVQKFVLDWAEEKTNTDIKYIFLIPFQKLNIIREKVKSFIEFLQKCFENTENVKIFDTDKIMFIFDGLNELKVPLDFQNTKKIVSLNKSASVAELLTNLIMRNLLPNSLIWITTRPGAASQIPAQYVDQVTEIHGFNDKQKEEYFKKSIKNKTMADRVISHIKTSRRIHGMCYIPDYCRLIATMSKMMFRSDREDVPKTLTQMYATFLAAQTMNQDSSLVLGKKNILCLGKLAFQQLVNGPSLICAEDLGKCGIIAESITTSSAKCVKMIENNICPKSFCFVNHRTQEFLAALYVIEMINEHKYVGHAKEFSSLNLDPVLGYHCLTFSYQLQNLVDKALERQLDVFLCFLLGLSLEPNRQTITQNIKTMILKSAPEKCSHLFNCLIELDDRFLVQDIKTQLKFGVSISAAQWSVLVFVLLNSEEQLDEIKPNKSHQSEKHSLRPVLETSGEPEVYQCGIGVKCCADLNSAMRLKPSHLRELDLSNNYIGDSGVKQISVLLKDPQCKLQKLWLRSCNITKENCADLSSALLSNLTDLDLSYNYINDSGVKLLTTSLKVCDCKLERLLLRSCHITEKGCTDLSSALISTPAHLKELDLSNNDIRDSGVKHISVLLKDPQCKLEKLWLGSCNIKEEGYAVLSSALRSNPSHLRELNLSYNYIGNSGAEQLSVLLEDHRCKLQKLWLQSCHIEERGSAFLLSALTLNPSHLVELDLSENALYSSGTEDISVFLDKRSCHLAKLMLRSCSIQMGSDLSLALRSNPSHLKELDLSENEIRDSGVKQLSMLLENPLCELQKLWLRSCHITGDGCSDLSSALKSNPLHLKELDLSNNYIGDSGVKHISVLLKDPQCKLQKLWLRSCFKQMVCSDLSSALKLNPSHLRELDLSGNYIGYSGMRDLLDILKDPLCKLVKLWLRSCEIYGIDCADLSSALKLNPSHLRELDLSNNCITDSGVKHMSFLEDPQCKLEKLWLRSCHITDEGCTALNSALRSNLSQLTELDLSDNCITDSGVKQISVLLKDPQCKLEKLWLHYSAPGIKESAVLSSAMRSNPSHLTELDLSNNDIRDSGVKQISVVLKDPQCKLEKLRLRSCDITDDGCTDLSSALKSNLSHLRELDLSNNEIRDSGVKQISVVLKDPQCKLQKLRLRSCHITRDGCTDLSSALKSNPSHLRELDLSNNDIRDSGVKLISVLLKYPQCKLQKLRLRFCKINEMGCSVLKSNPSDLGELDLSYNEIRDSGVKQISDLLKDPQCKLQKLWLRSCHITEKGCTDLSSALRSNPSHLRELDLSDNDIRDSGVKHISVVLKDPQCKLQKLRLRSCQIKEKGCAVLSSALKSNPSYLRELDMCHNDIRDSGVKQLLALLEDHQCKMEILWIKSCSITYEHSHVLRSHKTEMYPGVNTSSDVENLVTNLSKLNIN